MLFCPRGHNPLHAYHSYINSLKYCSCSISKVDLRESSSNMLLCDHRMVEGSPLRYTYDNSYQPDKTCSLFRPYLQVHHTNDYYPYVQEDILGHTNMSDSEGSISSASSLDSPKEKSLKCCWRNCGINFVTLDQLAAHVGKVHGASGPAGLFYCGWEGCTRNDRAFNARYKMLVHVRTHTNEKPHQCYQCDKSFSRAENLKIHIRSHSGEKPYACPVPGCNKAYSNSSDRFKHTRTHQDDKPYPCKVPGCSKRYTDPSSLRKHVKTYKHYATENLQMAAVNDKHHGQSEYAYKENYTWSGMIGRYEMDIDTPLDLSISRKT